ncbi:helix-turn-helix domain-containing protein [Isoptericola sediminis]|uniref:Winged helix-turn-helix transcriptional regulator n=1 Tax=Isoptericola sediminis TaxID=2733572 RepID=A0A849JZX3_9MICO|nr:winged helix-turn-helix transcriptional regulator [Isoptericola sediminis]
MTQQDVSATTSSGAAPRPRYRGRHLPMVAVVIAAFIATALAYSGMVLFGLEVANMAPVEAYALAGFLEVSLVAVALMARNAALEGRPYGVLLTLTWVLSGTSGVFAALHEIAVPNESTPYMVVFRFVPPLVAALMWHLALVGERHLVTGHTLDERRREHRVHQYVTALELWRDARLDSTGTRNSMRRVRALHERQRAARDRALKLLTVEDFERRMQVWVERLEAAERHGNRLDTIGASSVKRGRTPGSAREATAVTLPPARREVLAPAATREPATAEVPDEQPETFADTFRAALTVEETPAAVPTVSSDRQDVDDERSAPVEDAAAAETHGTAEPAPESEPVRHTDETTPSETTPSEAPQPREPLPETGHTRRVEMFDLVDRARAERAAQADGPTWSAVREGADSPQEDTDTAEETPAPAAGDPASDRAAEQESRTDASDLPTSGRDRRIVELARQGLTQREIADEVSASRSTVSRVVRRYEDQKAERSRSADDLELATV